MFTIVVTGSRGWTNEQRIRDAFEFYGKLYPDHANIRVIHGDARGADRMCALVAAELGMTIIPEPAQWDKYGRSAGYKRNEYMLKRYDPDVVIAFWDGESPGTAHTIKLAKLRKIKTVVVTEVTGVTQVNATLT